MKYLYELRDERVGDALGLPLLSVSIHRGVVPRSEMNESEPRADDLSNYKRCAPGDLVINRMSAYQGAVGISLLHGIVSPEYLVIRPDADVDERFLSFLVKSTWFVGMMTARVRGIGSTEQGNVRTPRINPADLGSIPVSVPPKGHQRAIADFLDAETARLNSLIAKKRSLQAAVEQRWRTEVRHEVAAAAVSHGWIPLKRVVQCLDGRRVPLAGEERAVRQGDIPYFGASGVIDHIDDWLFDEELVLLGEDGAQLGDPDYEISFVVRGKCWVNNHAHVLRPILADATFLALHLSCFDRALLISGATREKLTQRDMGNVPVPHISLTHQRDLGARLHLTRERARSITRSLGRQLLLLQEHRQALITAAVTGELKIPGVAA